MQIVQATRPDYGRHCSNLNNFGPDPNLWPPKTPAPIQREGHKQKKEGSTRSKYTSPLTRAAPGRNSLNSNELRSQPYEPPTLHGPQHNFPHKATLTRTQISNSCANHSAIASSP
ncbi:hypothetical protein CHARACLAT_021043 [Characodon lateralis]|uniref:Uncharacterized protein n=1 Tax=Characodon lateralis TaxID=208331 RepID=A0ABU7DIL0_9TELE|nr:hypothetical protein [Characodon lateralis]